MARKFTDALRPVRGARLKSRAASQRELQQTTKQISADALVAQDRFRKAARQCQQLIDSAHSDSVDEVKWPFLAQRLQINLRNARFYAAECKNKGLPKPALTEVHHLLRSLRDDWKIACSYREARNQPQPAPNRAALPMQATSPDEKLVAWIYERHVRNQGKRENKTNMLEDARRDRALGSVTKQAFDRAYRIVFASKANRAPASGWPLQPAYRARFEADTKAREITADTN